jgi:serine kinase of HPr protein (carbohydrate metabolism regulator)
MTIHASCIAIDGLGVLLRGPSGSGKSDLALRLIDGGARLVADDRVVIMPRDGRLFASAPAVLAGKLEIRGLGIETLPATPEAPVALIVDLVDAAAVERLPEPCTETIMNIRVARLAFAAFDASTPAKIRAALRRLDTAQPSGDSSLSR